MLCPPPCSAPADTAWMLLHLFTLTTSLPPQVLPRPTEKLCTALLPELSQVQRGLPEGIRGESCPGQQGALPVPPAPLGQLCSRFHLCLSLWQTLLEVAKEETSSATPSLSTQQTRPSSSILPCKCCDISHPLPTTLGQSQTCLETWE